MDPQDAILESARNRLRPIFMTASSLLGFLPLIVSSGAGSELYRGMGAVQLGGMIVSTLFTLVLVPTVFSLWLDARATLFAVFRTLFRLQPAAPPADDLAAFPEHTRTRELVEGDVD
jgi:HAE1 family hydrophobic/amphiphilic exporter-1